MQWRSQGIVAMCHQFQLNMWQHFRVSYGRQSSLFGTKLITLVSGGCLLYVFIHALQCNDWAQDEDDLMECLPISCLSGHTGISQASSGFYLGSIC